MSEKSVGNTDLNYKQDSVSDYDKLKRLRAHGVPELKSGCHIYVTIF